MRVIEIESLKTSYRISGSGNPVIVFLSGNRMPMSNWDHLLPLFESSGTLLVYDRLGTGDSDRPHAPQDGVAIVKRLSLLLQTINLRAPYVLVAHS